MAQAEAPEFPARLGFLHIAKNAGTSLDSWLESHFEPSSVLRVHPYPNKHQFAGDDLRRYGYVIGHVGIDWFDLRPDPQRALLSVVRDPVQRAVSWFFFFREWPFGSDHRKLRGKSFLQFIEQVETGQYEPRYAREAFLGHLETLGGHPTPEVIPGPAEPSLERAKANLARLAIVGSARHLDATGLLVAAHMGWRPPSRAARENVTQRIEEREAVTPALLDRVRDLVRRDADFVRLAERRFRADWDGLVERLGLSPGEPDDGRLLVDVHARLDKDFLARFRKQTAPPQRTWRADSGIQGEGWNATEWTIWGPARWTGPRDTATLDLRLRPEEEKGLELTLHAASCLTEDQVAATRLAINGVEATPRVWPGFPDAGHFFAVRVDRETLARCPGVLRLEIRTPVKRPRDVHAGSSDPRLLGLFVQTVAIRPVGS